MWNDWLSSLNGPVNEPLHTEIPEPIETPKRLSNPQQIERLQGLQAQHQQLQVQQLHLLHRQHELLKQLGCPIDSMGTETASTAPQSPSSAVSSTLAEAFKVTSSNGAVNSASQDPRSGNNVKSESAIKTEDDLDDLPSTLERPEESCSSSFVVSNETWQQFHALQAQQWAQALNQARIAKRQNTTGLTGGNSTTSASGLSGSVSAFGASGIGALLTAAGSSASGSGLSGGKRCKAYAAPKGVWKNNGGYNATIYVHKRRIYGPIRRDLSDAIEDRKEMEEALRELTAIHSSPDDAAILEVEMREVVAGLRNRSTPASRLDAASAVAAASTSRLVLDSLVTPDNSSQRKRLRLVSGVVSPAGDDHHLLSNSGPVAVVETSAGLLVDDVLGPFVKQTAAAAGVGDDYNFNNPLDVVKDDDDHDDFDHHDVVIGHHHFGSFTPQTGPMLYASSPMMTTTGNHHHHLMGDDMLPDSLQGGSGLWGSG